MTDTEITAPGTYTIRLRSRLSTKRFGDARDLLRRILAANYDPTTRTWTVTLDESESRYTSQLQTLRDIYDAEVERAGADAVDRAALLAERKKLADRLAEIDRLLGEVH